MVAGVADVVPADAEPLTVVPVRARHVATDATRTRAQRDVLLVEVIAAALPEVPLFQKLTLREGHRRDTALLDLVRRGVLELLVGLDAITAPDHVGIGDSGALLLGQIDHLVQTPFVVLPAREQLPGLLEDQLRSEARQDHDTPAEADGDRGQRDGREIDLAAVVDLVELSPVAQEGRGVQAGGVGDATVGRGVRGELGSPLDHHELIGEKAADALFASDLVADGNDLTQLQGAERNRHDNVLLLSTCLHMSKVFPLAEVVGCLETRGPPQ